ncbi:MAG: hypothetical protein ABEJ98_00700 [Candidatus Nanohaloarchaea archaeon]
MLSGVDSKLVVFKHPNGIFKTCIGPNVIFDGEYEEFSEIYNESLDEAFEGIEFERKRETYKSYEVRRQFAEQKEEMLNFLGDFFDEILSYEDIELRVAFSRFSKRPLQGGKVEYYRSVRKEREVELNDFIDELKHYFPVVAATETLDSESEHKVYLDNFSGEVTKGWDSLINNHDVDVLVNGDKVNKLVSLSDLIAKYLELYLNRFRSSYIDEDEIHEVMGSENIEVYEVDNSSLNYIVPHRPDNISVSRYYPEPLFLVLLDNDFKKEKEWFENSKYYDLVCRAAETRRSAVKFLDLDSDFQVIDSEDFLVFTGPKSESEAERIAKFDMGKPISVDNIMDIM